MKTKIYTKALFIIIIIFILFSAKGVFADENQVTGRILEVSYPDIPHTDTPITTKTPFPNYVKYIYYFAIGAGGIIALVIIVFAGLGYLTSAGNPGKMQESKEKILSALLGLAILAGSGVILAKINPELIVLDWKEPTVTIPSIPTGVVLCKEPTDVGMAWYLSVEFYLNNPDETTKKAIRVTLIPIVEEINKNCYPHNASADIASDFDNLATQIWFIPNWWYNYEAQNWYSDEFGAVAYDETGFKGTSTPYVDHLLNPNLPVQPYLASISDASSLIPFRLIYEPNPFWYITVYKDYNFNDGIAEADKEEASGTFGWTWWNLFEKSEWGDWFPKSMKTEGNILTVLYTDEDMSESFFSNNVANLEAYDNIIKWEECEDYEGERESEEQETSSSSRRGRQGTNSSDYITERVCAHSKVTKIFIIAAEKL